MCTTQQLLHIQSIDMENKFYSRATGRLKQSSSNSFADVKKSKPSGSTLYSIEDDEDDSLQFPFGQLSTTQIKCIQSFIRSITSNDKVEIDPFTRGIHWIGFWSSPQDQVTISCSMIQPIIINATVHLSNVSYSTVKRHSISHFTSQDKGSPFIMETNSSCQLLGRYTTPFVDSLIENCIVRPTDVKWSNIVIGKTYPIFIIVSDDCVYECSMTYGSCLVMDESKPDFVKISHPITGKLNWSFRSSRLTQGRGSGPYITIHGSGILQYQGGQDHIEEVAACFRECIESTMTQKYISRFIKSLNVIRKI